MGETEELQKNTAHPIRSNWKAHFFLLLEGVIIWHTPFSKLRFLFAAFTTISSYILYPSMPILPLILAVGFVQIFNDWYLLSAQLILEVLKQIIFFAGERASTKTILGFIVIQIGVLYHMKHY